MRSFAAISFLAAAVAAQSSLDVQSLLSLQQSYISVVETASDPGVVESSFVAQVTKGLSPQELSYYSSITAMYSLSNPASLATDTDLSSIVASATDASSASGSSSGSMSSAPTSSGSSGTTTSSSASSASAAGSSSSVKAGAVPTSHALNGLMAVAGAVGAAAVLL